MILPETASSFNLNLDAFIVPVSLPALLHYLRQPRHGISIQSHVRKVHASSPAPETGEALHINLGSPGIEEPDNPIEENLHVLESAIQDRKDHVRVLFSGRLERAVEAGLISEQTLLRLRLHLMAMDDDASVAMP